MTPHVHAEMIKAFAKGYEIECLTPYGNWIPISNPSWLQSKKYRIKDPYRELKKAAKDPTKQIRLLDSEGKGNNSPWESAGNIWKWVFPPERYEIRDKPDPYAELKTAAKDPTKQIRLRTSGVWIDGDFGIWGWDSPPEDYEIRDKPDPYAELKTAAKDPTKQIRLKGRDWYGDWYGVGEYTWGFDYPVECYEIRDKPDPYAELKVAAADPTKQIRHGWGKWQDCGANWEWTAPVDCYEIRDKPKAKVKMWQWVYRDKRGKVFMTNEFYKEEPTEYFLNVIFTKRADWTMIEVEE